MQTCYCGKVYRVQGALINAVSVIHDSCFLGCEFFTVIVSAAVM